MLNSLYTLDETIIQAPSNDYFRLHNHNEYEIYIFLEGDSHYVVEERNYSLSPGDMIIVRKHEMHRVFHNSEKLYRNFVLIVDPEFFKAKGCEEYENAFLNQTYKLGNKINADDVRSSGLYDAIMRLKKYSDDFTNAYTPIADSIMVEILYLINKINVFEDGVASNKCIKNVINYINNNFTDEITLDMLCSNFFVSKYHLCRIFKKATGLTIQNYITQKRLMFAYEFQKSGHSLIESAFAAGFKDYAAFYRAYTKRFGVSPKKGSLS